MSDRTSRREGLARAASSARVSCVPPATSGTVRTAILASTFVVAMALHQLAFGQAPKPRDNAIPVRYTDVRQAAGITFLQDATSTDEKYYLETMGTGVAWLD